MTCSNYQHRRDTQTIYIGVTLEKKIFVTTTNLSEDFAPRAKVSFKTHSPNYKRSGICKDIDGSGALGAPGPDTA